jgi:hypothetical protein
MWNRLGGQWGGQYGAGYGGQWGAPPAGWGMAAPKPGIIPLRPLAVSEILDGAFSVVREYPRVTLGLSAIVVAIGQLLGFAVNAASSLDTSVESPPSTTADVGYLVAGLAASAISAVALVVLSGMLTSVMGDAVLGRRTTIGETWRKIRPRFWTLLGAGVVGGLVPYLGLVACIGPGVFLWGAWAFMTPAVVLERVNIRTSIRRSWRLAVPDWLRVWSIRALGWLLSYILRSVIVAPVAVLIGVGTVLGGGGGAPGELGLVALGVITLAGTVAGTITAPFTAGVVALLYIDRRMRTEGLDVTLARVAAAEAAEQAGTG